MCGRFAFIFKQTEFIRQFGLRDAPALVTSYNIGPDTEIPVVLRSRKTDAIECHLLRWGFPGIEAGRFMNNARGETAHEKATFRDSFAQRRCLIPASGFYEWNEETRQPYYVSPADGYFGFAGLWTVVKTPAPDTPPRLCCTILTQEACPPFTAAHHRFPVVIPAVSYAQWLSPDTSINALKNLMKGAPPEGAQFWPVSKNVNRMSNNDENLVLPMEIDIKSSSPVAQNVLV